MVFWAFLFTKAKHFWVAGYHELGLSFGFLVFLGQHWRIAILRVYIYKSRYLGWHRMVSRIMCTERGEDQKLDMVWFQLKSKGGEDFW